MSRLKKFARNRFKSLIEHLEMFSDKKESETLHEIRVDIKKIKSILLLTADGVKGFDAHKNYKPFRTIFRHAGEVRDPEVMSGLLLEHNIPGIHSQITGKDSNKLIARFCKDIPSFIKVIDRSLVKLKRSFKKLKAKDLDKYLKRVKENIKTQQYPKLNMRQVHKIRKSIKTFVYLSEASHQRRPKLKKFYSKQAESIGQLHDRQVLLSLLTKANGSADKLQINQIRKECSSKKKEIRENALKFYGG